MSTAAIYARYSSDLQSERSIDDQVDLCRAYAARESLIIASVYEDRAQSGASMQGRLGLARLLRDAADRLFTCLIVESLDRLSRDQGDLAGIYKRLTFLGVEIREVHGGKATPINTAVRGLVGAIFLADLADKTRRGLSGRVRDGKSAGGRAYGYRPVLGHSGDLEIVAEEADVVRRIFDLYAAGASPRMIAGQLNAEGILPPRGTRWNASTINGSRARANGILGNRLYAGEIVWNKVKMVKDPDTGRRVSRPNPESQWQRREVEALRIVPPDLWQAVEARRVARGDRATPRFAVRHPFSGLLKCHACGGSMTVRDRKNGVTRIECSTHKESRACGNNRVMSLTRLEAGILGALRKELAHPDLIAAYVAEYNAERRRLSADRRKQRGSMEARLAAVTGEIERTVSLMIKGLVAPERHAPRLKELEAEEARLKSALEAPDGGEVLTLHPAAIDRYRAQLEALEGEFAAGGEPAMALRALVSKVIVHPDYSFAIEGRLGELLGLPAYPHGIAGEGRSPTLSMGGGVMVAGGRSGRSPTPALAFWIQAAA